MLCKLGGVCGGGLCQLPVGSSSDVPLPTSHRMHELPHLRAIPPQPGPKNPANFSNFY